MFEGPNSSLAKTYANAVRSTPIRSERAELLKFFVDNLWGKNLKNYPAKRIAIALSHVSVSDLYFMQSVAKDIMARRGVEAMNKWFWWSLKTNN